MQNGKNVLDGEPAVSTASGGKLAPWQLAVEVGDDALEPVLYGGSTVIVDCSDHGLEGGGLYAVRDGDRLALWVYHPGFDGLGCRFAGQGIGTLTVLGGGFRLRGPLPVEAIRLVGRVVEPGPDRLQALAELREQQARLLGLRETTRAALLQNAGKAPAERRWAGAGSLELIADRLATRLRDRAFADRFALEQRLDAIDARLALLDELIAALPARGLADALTKLETLAALQDAGADDLQTRLLCSAITALQRVAADGRRPGREANGGAQMEAAAAEPPAQPLELVPSPRQRRQ